MIFTAEIGCNHLGEFNLAMQMIRIFAQCGANIIKFQKRCPRELLPREKYDAPHPRPEQSYGHSYGAHREFLELDINQHAALKKECERYGVEYMASVWDMTSAREIIGLNPKQIKIPSPVNNNIELLDFICGHFQGMIHISTGMTTDKELELISKYISINPDRFVLYHSVSSYPTHVSDLCLKNITALKQYCALTGFSGHHNGIDADIAAIVYGATYLERHVTLSRMLKGTDHAFSLEPDDFKNLVYKVKNIEQALTEKNQEILECEKEFRDKLKKETA
jgi:Sialic acid synthase